jgi:hypothetical protein
VSTIVAPQPPPLAVPEDLEGGAQRVGQGDGPGGRVEHRRVTVGVGEPGGQRAGGHPVHLAEQIPGGVLIHLVERRAAHPVLHPQDLEQGELEVAQVAPEMTHQPGPSR